jgi:hypothetical protein
MPIDTAAIMPIADPALTGGTFIAELMAGLADGFRGAVASAAFPTRNACGVTQPLNGTFVGSAEDCFRERDVAKRSEIETALRRLAPRIPRHEFAAVVDHAVDSPGLTVATPETAAWLSLVAYVRHTFTDYDELLREGYDQESARHFVAGEITAILNGWGVRRRLSAED